MSLALLSAGIEAAMYDIGQLFLLPVQVVIVGFFAYACYAFGAFLRQAFLRRRGGGLELHELHGATPHLDLAGLEAEAVRRLEAARIVTRVAPLLGLVATMIPMGPALKALGDGQLADVSRGLMLAFAAVILSLLASALTYWVSQVRRRWYGGELLALEQAQRGQA